MVLKCLLIRVVLLWKICGLCRVLIRLLFRLLWKLSVIMMVDNVIINSKMAYLCLIKNKVSLFIILLMSSFLDWVGLNGNRVIRVGSKVSENSYVNIVLMVEMLFSVIVGGKLLVFRFKKLIRVVSVVMLIVKKLICRLLVKVFFLFKVCIFLSNWVKIWM